MTTIATLAVRLIGDISGFATAMNTAKNTAQETATKISTSLKNAGAGLTSVGQGMTAFVTLPILGAGVAALTMASDMAETKSKVSVVFGGMNADVLAWSQNSDMALGLSQQKALDMVSTFGAMGQSAGLTQQENVKWSQSLIQLGSDWASFYNLNPTDALGAIQSAVAGQYEPLRRMGIVINQTSVEQQAMKMGLMEEGGVLSDAARYQALYAIMVDKSAAAQGDFARTADGVANQTRIVRAQFENAAATLGTQLLPIATQFLGWISKAITWFQALNPQQQKWIMIILGIVAAAGPLLIIVGSLITAFGVIAGVIGAISTPILIVIGVIVLLGAAAYGLYLAWQNNFMGIQQVVQWVLTYISTIVKAWQAAFHGDWYQFGALIRQAWDMVWKMLSTAVTNAGSSIKSAVSTLITNAIAKFKATNWGDVGKNIVLGIAKGLLGALPELIAAATNISEAALKAIRGFLGIKSPSALMAKMVGLPMAQGVAVGFANGMRGIGSMAMPGVQSISSKSVPGLGAAGSGSGLASGGNRDFNNYGNYFEADYNRGQQRNIALEMKGA